MAAAADEPDLFAQAGEAWRQGRHDAAAELLEMVVAGQPRHAAALNSLALIALGRHDPDKAIGWLERAVAAEPGSALLWFNLARAVAMAADPERALAALDRALSIDPYLVPALLMKAETLGTLGRAVESAALYRAVIAASPSLDSLPEAARESLARGLEVVRADDERRAKALEAPLAEVSAAFPGADFHRAHAYAEQRTGRRKVYVQQPVSGHFPYLPAIEFFPREHFPWLAALEAETGAIRSELLSLWEEGHRGFRPYVAFDPDQPVNQWAELDHSTRWSAWFFWRDGERQDENCGRCPATAAALAALPLLDLPGKGPTAMFSILAPRTRIPPHTGSNNVRTTVHLPLVVPDGCGFRVGAETRGWRVGEAWAFDDTIEHEAWNDSDEPRAIFILDVWNPLLTEAERAAVRAVG
ncbi:MAG TPA: aspartyl/asparaginyl beta-hydroxylase domain-containing protein [Allosphingosinicella sp.]|nr:aspartyl/asparaginyl beta-hydroxylase domain-containing protein [Allosphingosinicella sp.]